MYFTLKSKSFVIVSISNNKYFSHAITSNLEICHTAL